MKNFCLACVAAICANAATAQEAGDVSVALGVSTLGANIEAAYQIDPTYRVRGALIGGIDFDYEESDDEADFEGSIELGGLALIGDFYPLQNGWRVSGGLLFSNSELSATGTADIEGLGEEDVTISAAFVNDIAPMITTGYDANFGDSGWAFNTEAGLIFTGGIDLSFDADNAAVQDQVDDDPDVQEAQSDAEDITLYPYVSLSVSYRF
ncbi:hypothetical protein [Yoonia sp. BS5-3]|uniref:Outer membrane protein n=1 Tax=Yoonia phaeophyticola TaxID=3137369 RepID=A0ABZ2V3Y6_9RHOB